FVQPRRCAGGRPGRTGRRPDPARSGAASGGTVTSARPSRDRPTALKAALCPHQEVTDVSITDDVVLTFDAELAGGADGGLRLVLLEIRHAVDLGTDERALEVGVDDAGGLG